MRYIIFDEWNSIYKTDEIKEEDLQAYYDGVLDIIDTVESKCLRGLEEDNTPIWGDIDEWDVPLVIE